MGPVRDTRTRLRRALVAGAIATAALGLPALASAAGPAASSFVPSGFRVEKRIATDIGGDARPDLVMVLVRRAPAGASRTDPPPLARRLVVLKARSDGGYIQIGEGRRVLLCTRCGGAFFGVAQTPVHLRVAHRVIIASQELGSRVLTFQRFRFRSEGVATVRLIGTDIRTTDRLTGVVVLRSTNLLTGRRIVTRRDADGRRTVRRYRVTVKPVTLEGTNLHHYG
jgi:hypothetical protein